MYCPMDIKMYLRYFYDTLNKKEEKYLIEKVKVVNYIEICI